MGRPGRGEPENFVLILAAVAAITQTGIPAGEQAIAYAVFTLIASIGAAVPIVIYFTLGDRSAELLGRLRAWMAHNNAVDHGRDPCRDRRESHRGCDLRSHMTLRRSKGPGLAIADGAGLDRMDGPAADGRGDGATVGRRLRSPLT